jgi:hypothetical protein
VQAPQGAFVTDPEKRHFIKQYGKKGTLLTNIKIIYLNAQHVSVYLMF